MATAYIKGFKWGLERGYGWIFEMDADFSHDPSHLKEFFRLIASKKHDGICGSRYIPGGGVSNWDKRREALSRGAAVYTSFWLSEKMADWTGGFNAWSAECLYRIGLDSIQSRGYTFQIEMKYRAKMLGYSVIETPIVFRERLHGQSKMSGDIVKEALWGVILLRIKKENSKLFV